MSIPDRLFRVARGYWSEARDRIEGVEAEAAAYQELADAIRKPSAVPIEMQEAQAGRTPVLGTPRPAASGEHDPMEAAYALLQIKPGANVAALEVAYEARMEELRPEEHPAGSPGRAAVEARRSAVEAAYEKLRDALNPTETRFERLEFE